MRKILLLSVILFCTALSAQKQTMPTPPMGFMTWNYFGLDISENDIRSLADAMVESGLRDAGYNYIFIDDGWQGGRDSQNNIIPHPQKFPSGMKALVEYVHAKGMKIGIYSDAAPLTCGGYTGSLHFEEQDAETFAEWGFDYLKYDYCNAPPAWTTAAERYEKMSQALKKSGRDIALGICEWGDRQPWFWARKAGGQLWRTTADIRDKWKSAETPQHATDLHRTGAGILDIVNINAPLAPYAAPGGWNDPDMLVVGLYGKKGAPSSALGGTGCTDTEYQSQMSLWCLMASPLMITCDVRNMNVATRSILANTEAIAINQDSLGQQAERKMHTHTWQVFVKPLANGDVAVGILNTSDKSQVADFDLKTLGIIGKKRAKDLWNKKSMNLGKRIKLGIAPHETILLRLS